MLPLRYLQKGKKTKIETSVTSSKRLKNFDDLVLPKRLRDLNLVVLLSLKRLASKRHLQDNTTKHDNEVSGTSLKRLINFDDLVLPKCLKKMNFRFSVAS